VPVVLSLATWDPDDPLEEWAAAEMAKTYPSLSTVVQAAGNMERTLAYQLISGNRVLMVLDGLDEMARSNQPKALQRLSQFAQSGQHFVVTCRTEDYARIVYQAGAPLAKTPVIALGPLGLGPGIRPRSPRWAVRKTLRAAPARDRPVVSHASWASPVTASHRCLILWTPVVTAGTTAMAVSADTRNSLWADTRVATTESHELSVGREFCCPSTRSLCPPTGNFRCPLSGRARDR
jgi:hypothetical protein